MTSARRVGPSPLPASRTPAGRAVAAGEPGVDTTDGPLRDRAPRRPTSCWRSAAVGRCRTGAVHRAGSRRRNPSTEPVGPTCWASRPGLADSRRRGLGPAYHGAAAGGDRRRAASRDRSAERGRRPWTASRPPSRCPATCAPRCAMCWASTSATGWCIAGRPCRPRHRRWVPRRSPRRRGVRRRRRRPARRVEGRATLAHELTHAAQQRCTAWWPTRAAPPA